jgi:hypothetical protein
VQGTGPGVVGLFEKTSLTTAALYFLKVEVKK